MGKTALGNKLYMLTITDNVANEADIRDKKYIVLTSRVHPGESNASFGIKGIHFIKLISK